MVSLCKKVKVRKKVMGNCIDCGWNGRMGHKKGCKADRKASRQERYRLRKKAAKEAADAGR